MISKPVSSAPLASHNKTPPRTGTTGMSRKKLVAWGDIWQKNYERSQLCVWDESFHLKCHGVSKLKILKFNFMHGDIQSPVEWKTASVRWNSTTSDAVDVLWMCLLISSKLLFSVLLTYFTGFLWIIDGLKWIICKNVFGKLCLIDWTSHNYQLKQKKKQHETDFCFI